MNRVGTGWIGRAARVLVPLLLAAACGPPPDGELVLRLRWSGDHRAGLAAVLVEPDWGGVSQHPVRDAGWRRFGSTVNRATLDASLSASTAEGAAVLTSGPLASGDYRRVFVAIPRLSGMDSAGRPVAINGHIEPIARSFRLERGQRVTIDLVLALLPTPEASPFAEPVQAFIMDAVVAAQDPPLFVPGSGT